MDFMENSGQLNENHHSYRKKHSTVTAMIQLSDAIFNGCNENKITTLVTLDQSAAFDVLSHVTLRKKLKLYNFSDSALKWMDSYLNFRSQFVSIGTQNSNYMNVKSGVPQGSVLGPILYVIYVNELPALMNEDTCNEEEHVRDANSTLFTENCKTCGMMPTYADDSTVVIVTKTRFAAQEKIVVVIDRVRKFLAANSLSLNLGKSEIVECMVRQKRVRLNGLPPQLSVVKPDGSLKIILAKESCKLLGLTSTGKPQILLGEKPILKNLRSVLGILTHLSKYLPTQKSVTISKRLIYKQVVIFVTHVGGTPQKRYEDSTNSNEQMCTHGVGTAKENEDQNFNDRMSLALLQRACHFSLAHPHVQNREFWQACKCKTETEYRH